MTTKKTRASRFVLVAGLLFGCGGDKDEVRPDGPPAGGCSEGDKECRADGLYTCDANETFQLTEACAACEQAPTPHCVVSCSDPGVTSICDGDTRMDCAAGTSQSCDPGTCVTAGKEAVCATKAGSTTCEGRRADGSRYLLACADANGVSPDQVCDRRTSECIAAEFDCGTLGGVPAGEVACDPSGNYYSSCVAGQPRALACETGSKCANDGSTNCYTEPQNGAACGPPTVCYPGLHCTQTAATEPSCVQPAGILDCTKFDVYTICTDPDTCVACMNGAVWWWKNLTTWGGSGTSSHATVPAGGVCIPGYADCKLGLSCEKSRFDTTGICETPKPGARAECTLTGQVSTGRSCIYDWHACDDGHYYDVDCRVVNVGGNVITICDCSVDGVKGASFAGDEVCNVTSTEMLDAKVRTECGWTVITDDVAPAPM